MSRSIKGSERFTAGDAVREAGARYKRYQIIEAYYPNFLDFMGSQGKTLPMHIKEEFDAYLKCDS